MDPVEVIGVPHLLTGARVVLEKGHLLLLVQGFLVALHTGVYKELSTYLPHKSHSCSSGRLVGDLLLVLKYPIKGPDEGSSGEQGCLTLKPEHISVEPVSPFL